MKCYRVGGAIRDQLLGLPVNDVDWVVVGATPQEMLDSGFAQVGRDFPVFLHPDTKQEYALARTERKTSLGYTGFAIHANPDVSLEQDLARRDLTINAIAQDDDGKLIDPYHGVRDLKQKILRHVTDAFVEDPLRVLRVARFAARFSPLGFCLAPETLSLMQSMVKTGELSTLVAERVWTETDRALAELEPQVYFDVLDHCGALAQIFPEITPIWLQGAPSGRDLLVAVAKANNSTLLRFTALTVNVEIGALKAMAKRLRVPKSYHQLAELAVRHIKSLHTFSAMDAAMQLQLLESMDVLRRPQRIDPLLCLARCHWQLQQDEVADYPQAEWVLEAMNRISNVTSNDLVKQGVKGMAMAQALRLKRLNVLEGLSI
ncbi:MAG: multifunctional CCA tRNA nucleotidyl transferase/2'3'-cyclic phosphodiesterase/2'nucleotidase/phosphatase [Gammaproteobacteria bacterium]|nr:multifunctional CCA tRNA nucleotidyl transferase/2'3'-cyclic phosphodiesterase/2'nucleotidase/phosphatase [Gammaproteobacteria bacterium]